MIFFVHHIKQNFIFEKKMKKKGCSTSYDNEGETLIGWFVLSCPMIKLDLATTIGGGRRELMLVGHGGLMNMGMGIHGVWRPYGNGGMWLHEVRLIMISIQRHRCNGILIHMYGCNR